MQVELRGLLPHAAQPAGRSRDTKRLQASLKLHGQLMPITLANDGETILSGNRRVVAARALGWKTIEATVSEIAPHSPEALDIILASNVQDEMDTLEQLHVLQAYEVIHGIPVTRAAERVGISPSRVRYLIKLSKACEEARTAVQAFERSDGKRGMSFSAFKQMADLSPEKQREILSGDGQATASKVKAARKRIAKEAQPTLDEDDEKLEGALDAAATLTQVATHIAAYLSGDGNGKAEVLEAIATHEAIFASIILFIRGE